MGTAHFMASLLTQTALILFINIGITINMFEIKFKKNDLSKNFYEEDESVSEALETICPSCSLDTSILWDDYEICFSRGGGISDIYNDIIKFLQKIGEGEKEFHINFLSSVFTCKWEFLVAEDVVRIKPAWFSIANIKLNNADANEKELQCSCGEVSVGKAEFMHEWHRFLLSIKADLISCGYDDKLKGFEYLKKLNDEM